MRVYLSEPSAYGALLPNVVRPQRALMFAMRAARRLVRKSVLGRMLVRAAFEELLGHLIWDDHVVADLAVARVLAVRDRPADVVLMERGTFDAIHAALDAEADRAPAFAPHLRKYRASATACAAERLALKCARRVIAASQWIAAAARAAGAKEVVVIPPPISPVEGPRVYNPRGDAPLRVLAPGPLIGRNGAHALLECARRMEGAIELVIAGRVADDPCAVRAYAGLFRCAPEAPLGWADVVVAPHLIDGYSREVERALARRIPVVATEAAGIDMQMPGVIAVSPGSGYEIARTLEALRHPVARGRLRADLAALAELRSPRRTAELLKIWVT
jgi:hypothetical protein